MMVPNMMPSLILLLVWLAMMAVMIGGYIVLLIAVWRAMRAHESIAASLQQIATKQSQ